MNSIHSNRKIGHPKQAFWVSDTLGWLVMFFINVIFQTSYFQKNFIAIPYSLIVVITGFLITILMRYVILKLGLIEKKFIVIIPYSIGIAVAGSMICVLIYTPIIAWLFDSMQPSLDGIIGNIFNIGLTLMIWTLLYVSFIFFENRQNLIQSQLNLSLQLKEAELNNLRKQLSPHFLFNSINNIRSLILTDPEKARDALLDISDMLRYALNYQKKEVVSIDEEMEVVMGYINLNKIHLGDRVDFQVEVDESLKPVKIPPMSIQLLVENAIKHGSFKTNPSLISIKIHEEENHRLIQVSNPGQLDGKHSKGIGIQNLKQRLQSTFNNKAAFAIFEENDQVTAQILLS